MKEKTNRLVVADAGWAKDIPEWIMEEIKTERTIGSMGNLIKPGSYTVGDAEILAYLFTLNLVGPIDTESSEIFIYLTGKLMNRCQKIPVEELPDFCKEKLEKGLSQYEKTIFEDMKYKIYHARGGEIYSPLFEALKELKKMKPLVEVKPRIKKPVREEEE